MNLVCWWAVVDRLHISLDKWWLRNHSSCPLHQLYRNLANTEPDLLVSCSWETTHQLGLKWLQLPGTQWLWSFNNSIVKSKCVISQMPKIREHQKNRVAPYKPRIPPTTPTSKPLLIYMDLETTGLGKCTDISIIEIGATVADQSGKTFSSLIHTSRQIQSEGISTGYRDAPLLIQIINPSIKSSWLVQWWLGRRGAVPSSL